MATVQLLDGRVFDDRKVRFIEVEPWFNQGEFSYGAKCAVILIEGEGEEHDVRTEHADAEAVWVEYVRELDPHPARLEFKRQRSLELVNNMQQRLTRSIVDENMKDIRRNREFRDEAVKRHKREFRGLPHDGIQLNPETGWWE